MILGGEGKKVPREAAFPSVSVVIAAFNAQQTIAVAVRSALCEPMVTQVIVVDDCSTDDTLKVVRSADDGSNRLIAISQSVNGGPASARNRGFGIAAGDYIAILDADDRFLPGRLAHLFAAAGSDWDLAADNIAFIHDKTDASAVPARATEGLGRTLGLVEFIEANISQPGRRRAELGFLKPVIRREFLQRNRLRYNPDLRLGEDFVFYVRAFLAGARFRITTGCGYIAVERPTSLSGLHRTQDLGALAAADEVLLSRMDRSSAAAVAVRRHLRHVRTRFRYRSFLDLRQRIGVARALGAYARQPIHLTSVLASYARDKTLAWSRLRPQGVSAPIRFLLEA